MVRKRKPKSKQGKAGNGAGRPPLVSDFKKFEIVEKHRSTLLREYETAHYERLLERFNSKSRNPASLLGDQENMSFRDAQMAVEPKQKPLVSAALTALDANGPDAAAELLAPFDEDVKTALLDGWTELRRRKTRLARARSGDLVHLPNGETYWFPAGLLKAACEAAAAEVLLETGRTLSTGRLRTVWKAEFIRLMSDIRSGIAT